MQKTKCIVNKLIYYYKGLAVFLCLAILATPQYTVFGKINFLLVGLGLFLCAADVFLNRTFLTGKRMILLLLFLLSFAISIVLNRNHDFSVNLMALGYSIIAMILFYPNNHKSKEQVVGEMYMVNNVFLTFTAILSTVSFIMYVILFRFETKVNGTTYIVGLPVESGSNRLFGLYSNPCFMITAVAMVFAILQFEIIKHKKEKAKKLYKAFLVYCIVINYLCMLLENSKGAYYSVAMFIACYVFIRVRSKYLAKYGAGAKTYFIAVGYAVGCIVIFFISITAVRYLLAYLPRVYYGIIGFFSGEGTMAINEVNLERDIPESYGALTGRPKIWALGIQRFLQKPVFGWGPIFNDVVLDTPIRHLHNLVIESLAGVGIVGSVFIFVFLGATAIKLLVRVFSLKLLDDTYYNITYTSFAILAMLAFNSMSEVTVLFMTRLTVLLFWMLLGQTICLASIKGDKTSVFDKPLLTLYEKVKPKA